MSSKLATTRPVAAPAAPNAPAAAPVPARDGHPWRAAIVMTLVLIAGALAWTMWVNPLIHHLHYWVISVDSWAPLAAGRYVSSGAYVYLYQADPNWVAGPLLPVLLAPVAAVQDALKLTSRSTGGFAVKVGGRLRMSDVPYPSIWIVYAGYAMAWCVVLLVAVRRVAWAALTRTSDEYPRRGVQAGQLVVAVLGLSLAAAYWMHDEDVLGLAMLLLGIAAVWRRRWGWAAVWCGLSIAFKQWTVLPVLLLVARIPRADRRRFLLVVLGIPGVLYGIPLAVDWSTTSAAFFHAQSSPWLGHAAAWVVHPTVGHLFAATPGRVVWVGAAVAVAWVTRHREDPEALLAGAALIFAVRMGAEVVLYSYYLLGVITFVTLLELLQRRSVLRSAVLGAIALAWFWVPAGHYTWWCIELGLVAVLVWPSIRTVARPASPEAGAEPDPVTDATTTATRALVPR